jgi:hypothetical protein
MEAVMKLFSLRTMMKLALVATLAGSAGGCTMSAHGRLRGPAVYVETAPPPPPPRRVVVYRPGYIWIEGRHQWNGNRYIWQDGYYERERAGHVYQPGRWERRGRGHVWIEGRWNAHGGRDRDRPQVRDHRRRN